MTTDSTAEPAQGRLAGRKILITGAASGIGHATAMRFVEEGAHVALLDVQDLGSWEPAPPKAVCIQVDLLDRARVPAAVQAAAEQMNGMDGVVNCAGISGGGRPLEELEPEFWDRVIGVNLTAPYLVCRAALPYLRKAEGATIVNVASGAAVLPHSVGSAYPASKGGLVSFSKALAYELAPHIRVNAVMPGAVNTPMAASTGIANHKNPNDAPFVLRYALKRVATPIELANAILFLTSSESSYVAGSTLAVDGGRTFH
jgi:NAD(P)-dependent dehydrogenase (short-subunit alcohol dehydrogenase family)